MKETTRSVTSLFLTLLAFAAAIVGLSNLPPASGEAAVAPVVVAQSTSAILEDRAA